MNFIAIFFIAIGLSMDALIIAVCAGLTMAKASFKKALVIGLYFGIFQAGMPLIGYFLAAAIADMFIMFSHWIVFSLFVFLGVKMIGGSFKKKSVGKSNVEQSVKPAAMLPLALATFR